MNRRRLLAVLASVPFVGFFIPKEAEARTEQLPDHFPDIFIVDSQGDRRPVPAVVDDDNGQIVRAIQNGDRTTYVLDLPLITVSKDGKTIRVFCLLHEDICQISEQFITHYGRRTTPRIGAIMHNFGSLTIRKWQICLY